MTDKSLEELMVELMKIPPPQEPIRVIMSERSKRLFEDVKREIKKNPSNYSREKFLNEIQTNHYDDKPKQDLIHELEEYGLYPLILNVMLGKYTN